ncbi:MAG TPA: diguanylate cyclase, partial [Burkholderiaceae bacterium]|nr:diguanylate cyclase [Burkholderiaceae bacterium]
MNPPPDRPSTLPSCPPAATPAKGAGWRAVLRVYADPDDDCAGIRARLVQWVSALSPWLLGFNLFIGGVLAASLTAPVSAGVRIGWWLLLAALSARGAQAWWRHRGHAPKQARPAVVHRAIGHAAVLASAWALVPWVLANGADAGTRVIVGGNMMAVIAAGAFGLCPLAPAALAYVAIIGLSSVAFVVHAGGTMAWAGVVMSGTFTLMTMAAVIVGASRAIGTLRAERAADRQRHLVGLLFADFESQSGDVLFETDADGRFDQPSPRLLALLELDTSAPPTLTLLDWFSTHTASRAALDPLRRAFATGQAFRQRELPVTLDGTTRFWALTARPRLDETGQPAGWRGVVTDITSERKAEARAQAQAGTDTLTGLGNRVRLRERLQAAVEAGLSRPAALLCLDMDHFRRVNDTLGHGAGDAVLREAGLRLQRLLGVGDLAARTAGDEYALLLESVH